jgi:hypothetical protein
VGAKVLGHRFAHLRDVAGVSDATLHRLRHTAATFLVARGQLLAAQARLGHADAATTLREYAHTLPLTDGHVADAIDAHLHLQAGDGASEPDAGPAPQHTHAPRSPPRQSRSPRHPTEQDDRAPCWIGSEPETRTGASVMVYGRKGPVDSGPGRMLRNVR